MSDQAFIKKQLLERKRELEVDMDRLSREKVTDDQVQDPGDQATSATLEELNISLANNERTEYDMLLKALDMLEKGTYGICTECGQPISEKRLQLYPNATRCLACQEALEERS
ncbi:MAG: TraR/DksA C4-type zinc finger protein [Candidatus Babeliaceae bacterium]